MMCTEVAVLTITGVALFLRELVVKCCWAFVLFLCRGEFNRDDDESTPDEFYLLNPYTDSWTHCYIFWYQPRGVRWGFMVPDMGMVYKTSNWLDWASFRGNRFPVPDPFCYPPA